MPGPSWWVKTTELTTGRGGVARAALGPREAVRKFRVIVNDKRVSQHLVSGAPGIPYLWSPYSSYLGGELDPLLPCVSLPAEQENHGEGEFLSWIVTANYSTDLGATQPRDPTTSDPNDPNDPQNNPELEFPELEWGGETMQRAFRHDLKGFIYSNSARVPFKPAIAVERSFRVFTYTRNELSHNVRQAEDYTYAVNSDEFMGYDPGRAQCMAPVARQVYRGGRRYWRVTYKFRFFPLLPLIRIAEPDQTIPIVLDRQDWQPHVLDAGMEELTTIAPFPGKHLVPIRNKKGMGPLTSDVPLDGRGKKAVVAVLNNEISPTFIKFKGYEKLPFAALMIRP